MDLFGNITSLIVRGGPAMIGLIVCSILAVAVIFERAFYLTQQHIDSEAFVQQIRGRIASGDIAGAGAICSQNKGMLPKIVQSGLAHAGESREDIDDALSLALRKESKKLDRNLAIIGTIAVIAPFVGLFGTVLGIIHAFDDIAVKGNSTPAVVAAGVSEALITTAAGLFVAVLAVIAFNYFKSRVKAFNQELTEAADEVADLLHRNATGKPIAGARAPRDMVAASATSTA